jgi:WD40 repeat protein
MKAASFFSILILLPSLSSATQLKDAAVELYVESGIHHSGRSVAFSSDGALIAAGSIDPTIKVWDTASGRELETLPSNHQVFSLAFVPDRPALIASNDDGTLVLWDLVKREAVWTVKCSDHPFPTIAIDALAFRLRCGDWGAATVRQWDLKTGSPLAPLPIHTDAAAGTWTLVGNGSLMALQSSGGGTEIVNVATSETVGRIPTGQTSTQSSAAYHKGAAKLATADEYNSFTLWSWPGPGAEAVLLQRISAPGIHAIAFSPDGSRIAYAAESGDVVILDASTLNETRRLSSYANRVENAGIKPQSSSLSVQVWYDTHFAFDLSNGSFLREKSPALTYNNAFEFPDMADVFGREVGVNKAEDHIDITNSDGNIISTLILLDKLGSWRRPRPTMWRWRARSSARGS